MYCKKDYNKKKIRENRVLRKEVNSITDRPRGGLFYVFIVKKFNYQRPYFVKLINQFAGRAALAH